MRQSAPLASFVLAALASSATAADPSAYETPPAMKASEVLSPEQRRGPYHQVLDPVRNDGFLNHYTVKSDFGRFEAESDTLLAIRLRELAAIVELEQLSKTEVFAKALAKSAAAPFVGTYQLATHPAESAKSAPTGVKKLFGRIAHVGEEARDAITPDDDEDGKGPPQEDTATRLAESAMGVTGAERRWAQKLGVDPYTTNPLLRQRLETVAKVDAAGSLSGVFVPRVPVMGAVGTAHDIVYTKDPSALRKANEKTIASWNIDSSTAEAFLQNGWYTPSRRTALIAALNGLEGVQGRGAFLQVAAEAESEVHTLFYVEAARLLLGYQRGGRTITRVEPDERLVYAVTPGPRHVWLLPVDNMFWTRELAAKARARRALHRDTSLELWVAGRVSERARRELTALGWVVRDRARKLLETKQESER